MAVVVSIASVNKSDNILWPTLRIDNTLNSQVDTCQFTFRQTPGSTYEPRIGNSVTVVNGSDTVFGGVIIRVAKKSPAFGIVDFDIDCSDYTRILDQHLVAETYENKTIAYIINDILTNWAPSGFTSTQVDATQVIDYIQFKYEPVSHCLKQLADLVGYDWYVDYTKDVFFQDPNENSAPFGINEGDGSFVNESLVIRTDNSQMRNSIIVRGGEYLGSTFTDSTRADGRQITFPLPYKYTDFSASLTGNLLNLGIDNIDDPNNFDALYNFEEKIIRFKETDKPSQNATLSFWGQPHLPVIVKYKDQTRIDSVFSAEQEGDGKYEYLIIDKSINSKEGARARAQAEINTYGDTLSEGEFQTETAGLRAGQSVTITLPTRSINDSFVVNKVSSVMKTPDTMIYNISLITTKTMNFVSVMKKLLLADAKKIDIKQDEVLDLVESANEYLTFSEVVDSSLSHNPQTESVTMNETFTAQSLNYEVEFVYGPQTPTGKKRPFDLDFSPLQ